MDLTNGEHDEQDDRDGVYLGCDCDPVYSRRRVLGMGVGAVGAVAAPLVTPSLRSAAGASLVSAPRGRVGSGSVSDHLARYGLTVFPRSEWAGSLPEITTIPVEPEVHTLVVHHSVTSNTHTQARVTQLLRGIHAFHTGPVAGGKGKGWPDIAYGFFVDRFGGVWEGRSLSLRRPVEGSATGGNQGSTRLVCLLGDFTTELPSDPMQKSLVALLAALADTHQIATSPGSTASFVSRGSNRWTKGSRVVVPTICGHRQLSLTTCPGDRAFALVPGLSARVEALRRR